MPESSPRYERGEALYAARKRAVPGKSQQLMGAPRQIGAGTAMLWTLNDRAASRRNSIFQYGQDTHPRLTVRPRARCASLRTPVCGSARK